MNKLSPESTSKIIWASAVYQKSLERHLADKLKAEDLARFGLYEVFLGDLASAVSKCTAGDTAFTQKEISQMIQAVEYAYKVGKKDESSFHSYLRARSELNSLTPMK